MRHPDFTCHRCGSANLKRSRQTTLRDMPKMALGRYPFRCLDCKERNWIDLRLFSTGKQMRCPRCLSVDVAPISSPRLGGGFWRNLLLSIGGHAYRCSVCTNKFVSFKKTEQQHPEQQQPEQQQPGQQQGDNHLRQAGIPSAAGAAK